MIADRATAVLCDADLGDGEQVPVGVLEPRDARAAGGVPDVVRILLEERVALERDTARPKGGHGVGGVSDLPAKGGKRLGLELADLLDAEWDVSRTPKRSTAAHEIKCGRDRAPTAPTPPAATDSS